MTQQIDFVDLYDFILNNEVTAPVTVVRDGTPVAVMLPPELYAAMRSKFKGKALQAHELSADDMQAIMDSEIPEELKQYNHEVEDN